MSYELSQQVQANKDAIDAIQRISELPTRAAFDGTEYIPITYADVSGVNGQSEGKSLLSTVFARKYKEKTADYTIEANDRAYVINFRGNNLTATIPDDLGFIIGEKIIIVQYGTGFSIAKGSNVTLNKPQAFVDTEFSVYEIRKTANNEFVAIQWGAASAGGGGAVDSVNSQTGVVVLNADDIDDASTAHKFVTAAQLAKIDAVANLEFQTEITASTTVFDGTQKGGGKIYPFNSSAAQTLQIDSGDYIENDTINIERRGVGTLEIVQGTGVRFRGVRDVDNRFFVNDTNSMVSLLCRGSEEFSIVGNLKRGYFGAVSTSTYGELKENDTNVDVTVTGSGFASNMIVTVSSNATQANPFTFVSATEITLHLTAVGVENDTVSVTYDNGDLITDVDAITILPEVTITYDDYTAWFKLDETSGTVVTDETGNHNGTNNGTTDINNTGKVNTSYAFNGTDNYISGLGALGITGFPFTVRFWIKDATFGETKHIMANNTTNFTGLGIYLNNDKIAIRLGDGSGGGSSNRINYTTEGVLTAGQWNHVSIKCTDLNTHEFKLNNFTVANTLHSGTVASASFATADYNIARYENASSNYAFELDELTVHNRALTDSELTDMYNLENAGTPII